VLDRTCDQPWLVQQCPASSRPASPIVERLKAMRCLAAVATHGSALRAAEALFISQPAVTRSVLEFERAYGVTLFERAARGMVPTVAGQRVARRAQSLLDHLARGAAEAATLAPPAQRRRTAAPERFAGAVPVISLQALLAVAQLASESKAGGLLGISQPAVNRALRRLEYLVGLPLLQRSTRGTRLNESGEALLRRVKLACAEARAIESELASWRGEIRGRVVIGALPLSVALFLPQAVDEVRRTRPEVEITVVDGTF
jgi:DNA-binding transcriptional LysR family regulator